MHGEEAADKAAVDFHYCLLPQQNKQKCASSVIRIMTSLNKIPIKHSTAMVQFATSQSLNFCTTTILYKWKFWFFCKILLILWSDIPREKECLLTECLGLLTNDSLTASMFCVWWSHVHAHASVSIYNVEALALNLSTHNCMCGKELFCEEQYWNVCGIFAAF
jgi:hypothetical protein